MTSTMDLLGTASRFVTRVTVGDPHDAARVAGAEGAAEADGGAPVPSTLHASMTLLRLPERRVGVTCQHVVQAYRERYAEDAGCAFLVGEVALDPEERLVDEERFLDLAVLDLDDVDPRGLAPAGGAAEFFGPPSWPLGSAEAGEWIALGGYAGARASRVIDAGAENIACEVAAAAGASRDGTPAAVAPPGAVPSDALDRLGGLSGGVGLVERGAAIHFVGVIFAVARSGAYLRLRPARFIRRDGTLLPRGSR
jgi:hypothetical protein